MEQESLAILARVQFGATASFHIIFPTLLIGISCFLSWNYFRWINTREKIYLDIYSIWLKIIFIIYIVGAISGVALSSQLDNIFGDLYQRTQEALIPIRKIELILAILLEGGCIGIMLLLKNPKFYRARFIATLTFNIGIFLTAFLVISRNSWMNTPTGVEWVNGQAIVVSYWDVLFNPSFPLRYLHMIVAGLLASSFFIMGLSAYQLIASNLTSKTNRKTFEFTLISALILSIIQIVIGDLHGHDTLNHQPMKIAAMEGQWETEQGASFKVFALPDMENETNHYSIEIPRALSLILTLDPQGEVTGLKEISPEDRPNVTIVFFAFRIMLLASALMLCIALLGIWLKRRGRVLQTWFLRLCIFASPSGLIAVIAGWIVAEVGRQPWCIYGVIKTADVITATSVEQVTNSLKIFSILYLILGILTVYLIFTTYKKNPEKQTQSIS